MSTSEKEKVEDKKKAEEVLSQDKDANTSLLQELAIKAGFTTVPYINFMGYVNSHYINDAEIKHTEEVSFLPTDLTDELAKKWINTGLRSAYPKRHKESTSKNSHVLDVTSDITFNQDIFTDQSSIEDEKQDIWFPFGAMVITGRTNAGKSLLADFLDSIVENTRYIRFSEPDLPSLSNPTDLMDEITSFLLSDDELLIVDSIAYFMYASKKKSAALDKGVNSRLLADITALNTVAALFRKTILLVVNPLSKDASTIDSLVDKLYARTAGYFFCTAPGSFSFEARTKYNNRTEVKYTFPLPDSEEANNLFDIEKEEVDTKVEQSTNKSKDDDVQQLEISLMDSKQLAVLFRSATKTTN